VDAIVVWQPQKGGAQIMADAAKVPVINGEDSRWTIFYSGLAGPLYPPKREGVPEKPKGVNDW